MLPLVLVDTNIWISAFINSSGFPAKLKDAWFGQKFRVVVSLHLLEEIAEVLKEPRIKNKYSLNNEEIERFFDFLGKEVIPIMIPDKLRVCRDVDDNRLIETAILGKVEYLVTRDDDIKRDPAIIDYLKKQGVEVLTVSKFLKKLDIL